MILFFACKSLAKIETFLYKIFQVASTLVKFNLVFIRN
nr:MAG TPA: hypothetical protein [Caudoviricetes sp.]